MSTQFTLENLHHAGKAIPATVTKPFHELAKCIISGENNSKDMCIRFLEFMEAPDLKAAFPDLDAKAIIDKVFAPHYTGNTAYKYAQCAKLYRNNPDVWKYFTVGKMIITSRLESNKQETKRSTALFIHYVGVNSNNKVKEAHEAWQKQNAETLESIECLKKAGKSTKQLELLLSPEPPKPYEGTESVNETMEHFKAMGLLTITRMTDKQLKEAVKAYIDDNMTEKEREKAEKAEKAEEAEGKETPKQSPLDTAIAALTAYTSTLQTVPVEYTKALAMLNAERGDK